MPAKPARFPRHVPKGARDPMQREAAAAAAAMKKCMLALAAELAKLSAGRAVPEMLLSTPAECRGRIALLRSLAAVSSIDGLSLSVTPFDKAAMPSIAKSLREAHPSLCVSDQGHRAIVSFPPPSAERRQELARAAKALCEQAKVAVRRARAQAHSDLKRALGSQKISEACERRAKKEIEEATQSCCAECDALCAAKTKELLFP